MMVYIQNINLVPDYLFGIHAAPVAVGVIAAATGVRMAGTEITRM